MFVFLCSLSYVSTAEHCDSGLAALSHQPWADVTHTLALWLGGSSLEALCICADVKESVHYDSKHSGE